MYLVRFSSLNRRLLKSAMKHRNQHASLSSTRRVVVAPALAALVLSVFVGRTPFAESGAAEDQKNSSDIREQHWSFRPVVEPAEPSIHDSNWVKTPVDRFIVSKLERAGMKPSLPAD